MKKIDIKTMEEMLPDYVFGKLDEESKKAFENNLLEFPDIQKEVEEAKKVFQRFESMDIDAILSPKTKNISVRVRNRLEKKYAKKSKFSMVKYYLPIAASIALIFVFVSGKHKDNSQVANSVELHQMQNYVSVDDVNIIIDSNATNTEVANTAESIIAANNVVHVSEIPYDDDTATLVSESLLLGEMEKFSADEVIIDDNTYYGGLSGIEELSEEQFQSFLKELRHDKY